MTFAEFKRSLAKRTPPPELVARAHRTGTERVAPGKNSSPKKKRRHRVGLVRSEGGAVDAVAGERVVDVGDGGDAAVERDLLAGEAAWVSGAVEALVVCPRDQGGEASSSIVEPARMR